MVVKSITVGPGTLTIGALAALTNFSSQVTACTLVPSIDNGDPIDVLSGETIAGDRSESFALEGTLVQDFGSVGSTTEWCFANRGISYPFVFAPSNAAGREITGTIVVEAIQIGGSVKSKPTADFTWALIGAPVFGARA